MRLFRIGEAALPSTVMATRLLLTADRRRTKPGAATTAFDLWKLVRDELGGQGAPDARVRLLRHAMIHAGMLTSRIEEITADDLAVVVESQYGRCPICNAALA